LCLLRDRVEALETGRIALYALRRALIRSPFIDIIRHANDPEFVRERDICQGELVVLMLKLVSLRLRLFGALLKARDARLTRFDARLPQAWDDNLRHNCFNK